MEDISSRSTSPLAIPAVGRSRLMRLGEQARTVAHMDSAEWLTIQRAIFREMERWLDRGAQPHTAPSRSRGDGGRGHRAPPASCRLGCLRTRAHADAPPFILRGCACGLKETLEEFKRWTGHQAAAILGESGERFWQREWFDHWSRSDEQDEKIAQYIRQNPVKAGLVQDHTDWPYGFMV